MDSAFVIDPETKDIFVMTTSRLACGTPEHSAKLLEVVLQLGTRKA